jgi:3-hydroxyacyl-[acyl-carrier-protein] dehydratase
MNQKDYVLDSEGIKTVLPHRYPFLLVDRLVSVSPPTKPGSREGKKAIAIKNVTANEPYFTGHFPHQAIMPGVLLIEAMAQAGGLACFEPDDEPLHIVIARVKDAKFRKPVVPGDQVKLIAEVMKDKGKILGIQCEARVDDELVAETYVLAHISPRTES